jgi:ABC-type sulfate transport system permease component
MNQFRNIGTVRLSAVFCLFLLYLKIIIEILLIYFLTHLNLPARKLFYAKNIREAFGPLAYTPEVTPMVIFENYSSFVSDLD